MTVEMGVSGGGMDPIRRAVSECTIQKGVWYERTPTACLTTGCPFQVYVRRLLSSMRSESEEREMHADVT